MEKFTVYTGTTVPLMNDNIDIRPNPTQAVSQVD